MGKPRQFSLRLRANLHRYLEESRIGWRTIAERGGKIGGASGHRLSVEFPVEDVRQLDERLREAGLRGARQSVLRGLCRDLVGTD